MKRLRSLEAFFERMDAPLRAAEGKDEKGRRIFAEICPAAQPALAAAISRAHKGRVWVVCPDVRSQETFATELAAWQPQTKVFPELEINPGEEILPDPETVSERLALLREFASGKKTGIMVLATRQLAEEVPAPEGLASSVLTLRKGDAIARESLVKQLAEAGFEAVPQVTSRGQFSVRGGIMDVYAWQHALPVRVEFFGDEIDSLREFDIDSQVSINAIDTCELLLRADAAGVFVPLHTYIQPDDLLLAVETDVEDARVVIQSSPIDPDAPAAPVFLPHGLAEVAAGDIVLNEARRTEFFSQCRRWLDERWTVFLFCNNEGEARRFEELAEESGLDLTGLRYALAPVTRGFIAPEARLVVLSDSEIFGRASSQRARAAALRRQRARERRAVMDFSDYEEGDYVVHIDHGVGRFEGLRKMESSPNAGEVLVLEYAGGSRLYVPLEEAWKVSRYVGIGRHAPDLSEMGGKKWEQAKHTAQRSIREYAQRLLRLHAERETQPGFAFAPDNEWQREFEESFLFKETPDQLRAVAEIKADMESSRPMDRLLCGDVGFGKTEVAIRAAFKAVMNGKQVAVLAPTTVLAQQHYQTFRERMSDYPVVIELLNRYRTKMQQAATLKKLTSGEADIVIGTHRLLSEDVHFKDLGLVIVDEEQRFGVKHKELLKERFRLVDVLTLSATPIPRTLYLALMGSRDMSLIETPPPNRLPVETVVCAYDERIIRDAITRELDRGGQVYFLHNRIGTIEKTAARIRELCKDARVVIGHGQMPQGQLEDVMRTFLAGEANVLVSTTIIESGLDIPNANTIIIDRADRFGLADLYQLRGRVGRAQHKAYAYLLLPRDLMTGEARKRVSAIRQYSELGAGFRIAMRDLEIRGAGNLLGTAQSGHIMAIGFDLYCRMLKRAVEEIKGGGRRKPLREPILRLDFVETHEEEWSEEKGTTPAFIPTSYIQDARLRIEAYRKLAEATEPKHLDDLLREWSDRFGPPPPAVVNAITLGRIRLAAAKHRVERVETRDDRLMLTRNHDYVLLGSRFPRLTAKSGEPKLREVLDFLENL